MILIFEPGILYRRQDRSFSLRILQRYAGTDRTEYNSFFEDTVKAGQTFIYETLLVWCEHKRSGAADADK